MKLIINKIKLIALILTLINVGLILSLFFLFGQALLTSLILGTLIELSIFIIYLIVVTHKWINNDLHEKTTFLQNNIETLEFLIKNHHQMVLDLLIKFNDTTKKSNIQNHLLLTNLFHSHSNEINKLISSLVEKIQVEFIKLNNLEDKMMNVIVETSSLSELFIHSKDELKELITNEQHLLNKKIVQIIELGDKINTDIKELRDSFKTLIFNKSMKLSEEIKSHIEKHSSSITQNITDQELILKNLINDLNNESNKNLINNNDLIKESIDRHSEVIKGEIIKESLLIKEALIEDKTSIRNYISNENQLIEAGIIKEIESIKNTIESRASIISKLNNIVKEISQSSNEDREEIISNFIENFNTLSQNLGNKITSELNTTYNRVDALLSIHNLININAPLPIMNEWRISSDYAHEIVSCLLENKGDVIDIGSGVSTILLGYAVKRNGIGKVTAIEHSEKYYKETKELIAAHNLTEYCDLYLCPLTEYNINEEKWIWYNIDDIILPQNIILLSVDGPPGSTQYMARYPALPILKKYLSEKYTVFLDDGYRKEEAEISKKWKAEFNLNSTLFKSHKGFYKLNN